LWDTRTTISSLLERACNLNEYGMYGVSGRDSDQALTTMPAGVLRSRETRLYALRVSFHRARMVSPR
jgi:hypothetical protein